jgi:hypothetical protein
MLDKKVRLKKIKKNDAKIHLSVPEWWKDAAADMAHSQGIGLSEYLRTCVEKDLVCHGVELVRRAA